MYLAFDVSGMCMCEGTHTHMPNKY